jgi:hypothetical protein
MINYIIIKCQERLKQSGVVATHTKEINSKEVGKDCMIWNHIICIAI